MTVAATRFAGSGLPRPATSVTITGPENVTWGNIAPPLGGATAPTGPTSGRGFPR